MTDPPVHVTHVLAPNPGPMTLEGTNTWVLAAPGGRSVVIDCGPNDTGHLSDVVAAATAGGRTVGAVLLTHGHLDHAEGVPAFEARTGAALRRVEEGDVVDVDGLRLQVLATPGHTADSVCFLDVGDGTLYTGDTLLGRGTTVVAHPDGRLADYLASLARLAGVDARRIAPGHGPVVTDVAGWIAFYREHRRQRLDAVRAAVAAGATTADQVLDAVYVDIDPALRPAATLSVRAQLEYLRDQVPG